MRACTIRRTTKETDIELSLDLDGTGRFSGSSGIGFFDHMLTALTVHGGFDLKLKCDGDLYVDGHHTVEDCGIVLGKALAEALGDKSGIVRFGSAYVPMDEALSFCAVDISGRPYLVFDAELTDDRTGTFDNCLTEEFFRAFAFNAGITLHVKNVYGRNDHHKIESLFKAVAYALKTAVRKNSDGSVVSTKGTL